MLAELASSVRAHSSVTVPWSPSFCASSAGYTGVFLVAAHFEPSAGIAGAWALEVGAVFRGRRSRRRMGAIVVAIVFVLVLVVVAFR